MWIHWQLASLGTDNQCDSFVNDLVFFNPTPTLTAFTGDHQSSWTLTPDNSMQVSNMQSYNHKWK